MWTKSDKDSLYKLLRVSPCHCGTGSTWDLILELLQKAKREESFYRPMLDASARWAEFSAHMLDLWGAFNHGTGIGIPFLTEEGELLLRFLVEYGTDDEGWPGWAFGEEE